MKINILNFILNAFFKFNYLLHSHIDSVPKILGLHLPWGSDHDGRRDGGHVVRRGCLGPEGGHHQHHGVPLQKTSYGSTVVAQTPDFFFSFLLASSIMFELFFRKHSAAGVCLSICLSVCRQPLQLCLPNHRQPRQLFYIKILSSLLFVIVREHPFFFDRVTCHRRCPSVRRSAVDYCLYISHFVRQIHPENSDPRLQPFFK